MVPSHRNQAAKEAVGTERCCLGWRVRLITQQRQYRHAWRGDHCPCPHAPFLLSVSQCQLNSADLATCLIPSSCHARQGLERNTAGANALTFLNQKLTYQLSEKKERLLHRISVRLITNFSTAIMEDTRQGSEIFKVLREEYL